MFMAAKRSLAIPLEEAASSSKKSEVNEGLTPSELCQREPVSNICVEGFLVLVGESVDDTTSIPLVGFDPSKQQDLVNISKSPEKKVKLL